MRGKVYHARMVYDIGVYVYFEYVKHRKSYELLSVYVKAHSRGWLVDYTGFTLNYRRKKFARIINEVERVGCGIINAFNTTQYDSRKHTLTQYFIRKVG